MPPIVAIVWYTLLVMVVSVGATLYLHRHYCLLYRNMVEGQRPPQHTLRCVCGDCYQERLQASMESAIYEQQQRQIASAVEEASKL